MNSNPGNVLVVTDTASFFRISSTSSNHWLLSPESCGSHRCIAVPPCQRLRRGSAGLVQTLGAGNTAACRQIRDLYPQLPLFVLADLRSLFRQGGGPRCGCGRPRCAANRSRASLQRAFARGDPPLSHHVPGPAEHLAVGDLSLDLARHRVQRSGSEIALTPLEFRALHVLMEQAGRPITHASLLARIWGPEYTQHREYLRVLIHGLRKKLEDDPAQPVYLLTHSHFGYLFRSAWTRGQAAAAG